MAAGRRSGTLVPQNDVVESTATVESFPKLVAGKKRGGRPKAPPPAAPSREWLAWVTEQADAAAAKHQGEQCAKVWISTWAALHCDCQYNGHAKQNRRPEFVREYWQGWRQYMPANRAAFLRAVFNRIGQKPSGRKLAWSNMEVLSNDSKLDRSTLERTIRQEKCHPYPLVSIISQWQSADRRGVPDGVTATSRCLVFELIDDPLAFAKDRDASAARLGALDAAIYDDPDLRLAILKAQASDDPIESEQQIDALLRAHAAANGIPYRALDKIDAARRPYREQRRRDDVQPHQLTTGPTDLTAAGVRPKPRPGVVACPDCGGAVFRPTNGAGKFVNDSDLLEHQCKTTRPVTASVAEARAFLNPAPKRTQRPMDRPFRCPDCDAKVYDDGEKLCNESDGTYGAAGGTHRCRGKAASASADTTRAMEFLGRYPAIYALARHGAIYQIDESRDLPVARDLVNQWPDMEHLAKMLELFLLKCDWAPKNEPGTPAQFRHMAPSADALLRKHGHRPQEATAGHAVA
jgi:hypothetical protein